MASAGNLKEDLVLTLKLDLFIIDSPRGIHRAVNADHRFGIETLIFVYVFNGGFSCGCGSFGSCLLSVRLELFSFNIAVTDSFMVGHDGTTIRFVCRFFSCFCTDLIFCCSH